jgi:hypothetical protein
MTSLSSPLLVLRLDPVIYHVPINSRIESWSWSCLQPNNSENNFNFPSFTILVQSIQRYWRIPTVVLLIVSYHERWLPLFPMTHLQWISASFSFWNNNVFLGNVYWNTIVFWFIFVYGITLSHKSYCHFVMLLCPPYCTSQKSCEIYLYQLPGH